MRRIAILSLADINNYGDVFFPLVIREELKERLTGGEIDIITNTGYSCSLFETISYAKKRMRDYDVIIYGGGEVISPYDNNDFKSIYSKTYKGVPSNIAYEWLDLEDPVKIWFGIGAHPILFDYPKEVQCALDKLDYLCVRGTISKKVLDGGFTNNNGKIRVIPDLGWLFPKYVDESDSEKLLLNLGINKNQSYMVFEAVSEKNIPINPQKIAMDLVSFQRKSGVKVLLLPIIKTKGLWDEMKIIREIEDAAAGELTRLPSDFNVLQTGAILKNAEFFVGSSLHGAITMLSYGKPVVNIRGSIHTKLQDIHASRYRSTCFVNDWECLPGVLERLNNEAKNKEDYKYAMLYAEYMKYRLEKEFDNLAMTILEKSKQ